MFTTGTCKQACKSEAKYSHFPDKTFNMACNHTVDIEIEQKGLKLLYIFHCINMNVKTATAKTDKIITFPKQMIQVNISYGITMNIQVHLYPFAFTSIVY